MKKVLQGMAKTWFVTAFFGQIVFAFYILMLYWRSAAEGHFEKWNSANPGMYIKGHLTNNAVFGSHVALAAIITILGPLQLIPQVRNYTPKFHRISGRVYIYSAFLISLAGIYMVWTKGAAGGFTGNLFISMNALIIIACALFTVRKAMQRNVVAHQRWAVHLFLGVCGVWLFRIFLMLWLFIFKAPVGFDMETFTGPFLTALAFFVYVFPQGVVALYFYAKESTNPLLQWGFTTFLFLITVGTAIGTFSAAGGLWLPRL